MANTGLFYKKCNVINYELRKIHYLSFIILSEMFIGVFMAVQSISSLNFGTTGRTKQINNDNKKLILVQSDYFELRQEKQKQRRKRNKQILAGLAILIAAFMLIEFHRAKKGKDTIFDSTFSDSGSGDIMFFPVYAEEAF